MKVRELIKNLNVQKIIGNIDVEVTALFNDSRNIQNKSMYFAITGLNTDGHSFAYYAASKGAVCIVCEHEVPVTITQIVVENSRAAMGQIASAFYGNPSEKLKMIGITGTNGKTTITYIIKSIAEAANLSVGVIGTSGCYIKENFIPTNLTTPDPIELNRLLSLMVKEKIDIVAMEVSAHALALNKIEGIKFEVGIFSNLTQDHLDYFQNMNNYKAAKKSFFDAKYCKYALVNTDDECGMEIYSDKKIKTYSYAIDNPSEMFAINMVYTDKGIKYTANIIDNIISIESSLYGRFNVYNTLAAAGACYLIGIDILSIHKGINNLKEINGRFNVIDSKRGYKIIVDYAHTPDGIKNVLTCAKELCDNKLICVFGCGGNRDKTKRVIMGSIASEIADFCVITSDNPRFEDPMEIIYEIEKGVKKNCSSFISIENRKKAITYALMTAQKGDIVAILGKGGELYQEITGVKYPYNDYETVNNILSKSF